MSPSIIILGGLGYLGFNVARYYLKSRGADFTIVIRKESIDRRYKLYDLMKNELGVNFITYDVMNQRSIENLFSIIGCPDIIYNFIGALKYNPINSYYAHSIIPYIVQRAVYRNRCSSLFIHISTFYPSLSLTRNKIWEEYPHLNGFNKVPFKSHYEVSKLLGEYVLKSLYDKFGGKIVIIRPGLIIGEYPYHIEWIILHMLGKARIRLRMEKIIPLTMAIDIPRISEYLYEIYSDSDDFFEWLYATRYHISLSEISKLLSEKNMISVQTPYFICKHLPLPRKAIGDFLYSITRFKGAYYIPYRLLKYGFRDWSDIRYEFRKLRVWLKNISLLDVLKPILT